MNNSWCVCGECPLIEKGFRSMISGVSEDTRKARVVFFSQNW